MEGVAIVKLRCVSDYSSDHLTASAGDVVEADDDLVDFLRRDSPLSFDFGGGFGGNGERVRRSRRKSEPEARENEGVMTAAAGDGFTRGGEE